MSLKVLDAEETNIPCQYSFDELDQSLNHIGLTINAKGSVYNILAAILHLCNLEFHEDTSQNAKISNDAPLNDAARLLKIDADELRQALINRQFKAFTQSSPILYVTKEFIFMDSIKLLMNNILGCH